MHTYYVLSRVSASTNCCASNNLKYVHNFILSLIRDSGLFPVYNMTSQGP